MIECKFEIGKKYKFRDCTGWAELIYRKTVKNKPLIFVDDEGATRDRQSDGSRFGAELPDHSDVLPIEHIETIKVTKYVWMKELAGGNILHSMLQDVVCERSMSAPKMEKPNSEYKQYRVVIEEVEDEQISGV